MAAQGYIGRAPGESSVVVARQTFTPTGITTNFTFASGYTVGYVDAYLNGARLIEGSDYTATDGSVVGLSTNAINGDVLELVVYKAFNVSNVVAAKDDFSVGGDLSVTGNASVTGTTTLSGNTTVGTGITLDTNGNVNVSGVLTANSFVGDGTQLTGVGGGSVISGITIREEGSVVGTSGTVVNVNFVGADVTATAQAGFSTITIAGGGKFINFTDGGTTGITTTAKTKIQNNLEVTGVGTVTGDLTVGGVLTYADVTNVDSIGIITARSNVSIADKIVHTGDTNTSIRFPAADTFTVETAGSERTRVDSSGRLLINTTTSRIVEDHVGNGPQGLIQIEAEDSAAIMSIISAGDVDANRCGTISLGRHRNGTVGGTPTIVQDGDALGAVVFSAGDGTDMRTAGAKIFAEVDGTPGSNDMPGALILATTADGAANATERLRIDSSGRTLIGATSSATVGTVQSVLQVSDTSGPSRILTIRTEDGANGSGMYIAKSRNGGAVTNNDQIGGLFFIGHDGTDLEHQAAQLVCEVDGAVGTNDIPGRLVFKTTADGASSSTERLRITSAGRVGINTTAPEAQLTVKGDGNIGAKDFKYTYSNTHGLQVKGGESAIDIVGTDGGNHGASLLLRSSIDGFGMHFDPTRDQLRFKYTVPSADDFNIHDGTNTSTNTEVLTIGKTGICTATQFDATSDVTLKENIAVINEPITKLSELKGVTFDWKAGGHSVGVIAQDVEKVLPTAVGGSEDRKTVNYNAIIGLLVESVKDQQKQIEELKSLLDK